MSYDNKSEQSNRQNVGGIPRGIEVLVKKASVDPAFRELLIEKRAEAAREIDLELTEAEQNMLANMPAEQLEKIIDNTKVKPEHLKIFLGKAGMLMLAVVVGAGVISLMCPIHVATAGISPDRVRKMQMERTGDANDMNEPNQVEIESDGTEPSGTGERK